MASDDVAIPSFRLHKLRGDLAGHWSIWVSGNWRVAFTFVESDVELVDYQDYHQEETMTMKSPIHPGEILREDVLADLGLGVTEAADRLGMSRVTLSRVLHGHARISPGLAVRLEEAGVSTARAWLSLQAAYDLARERKAGAPRGVRRLDTVA
jgi:addiction module HigA family antidote